MKRFKDDANEDFKPFIDLYIFQTLSSIDRVWRFLDATLTEYATYCHTKDSKDRIGPWTKRKHFAHKSMGVAFWLSLKSFKEDIILTDNMFP